MQSAIRPQFSIITPTYRCSECIVELWNRTKTTLEKMGVTFEVIFVNDASPDSDWEIVSELASSDARVKGINLSRNFGQHNAITAGVDFAQGNWIVVMDCDLQHQPEDIPKLYREAVEKKLDIVLGRKKNRVDSFLKKLLSKLHVFIFRRLSEVQFDRDMTHFSIASRRAISGLQQTREQGRSYALSLLWCGFKVGWIDIDFGERFAGTSSYSFLKALSFALVNVTSYSNKPLTLSIQMGFAMAGLSFLAVCWLILKYLLFNAPPTGWTSLMVSLFMVGGLILMNLGILGLYLGKVFDESKKRPLYLVMDTLNVDRPSTDEEP